MLFALEGRKRAWVVPLLPLGFGAAMLVVAGNAIRQGGHWGLVAGAGAFAAFVLWMALDELCALRVEAGELRLWGPFRRRRLRAAKCVLGVRLHTGSRSVSYIVFVTDGEANADLGEWATERGARGGLKRLEAALFAGVSAAPDPRAQREVASVEHAWQASQSEAKQTIDAYYASPAWRRSKYLIAGIVIVYSVGMLLYQYFSGQLQ